VSRSLFGPSTAPGSGRHINYFIMKERWINRLTTCDVSRKIFIPNNIKK